MKQKTYQTESVEIARIVKKDGTIRLSVTQDTNQWELYGFLKLYVDRLESGLYNSFEEDGE